MIRRCVAGFLLAAGVAVPAFLVRAATGPWVWPLVIAGLVALTLMLARLWPEIDRPLEGAALGCAAGLGFAVVLSQHHVFVDSVWILMSMVAAFSGVPGAHGPAEVVQRWANETVWGPADVIAFAVAAPLLAALAGAGLATFKRRSRSEPVIGESAPAQAPSTGAAHE